MTNFKVAQAISLGTSALDTGVRFEIQGMFSARQFLAESGG
jgi:hypothetical protein